ncbi:MAG: DUF2666 family protein [Candidatus Micrarchaeota archaeon]|nr:DUF2666 family protein [Candidatus Micrarchaeota archaeon]
MDEAEEYIDFMAKYRDWISIKRLGIRENTKPEEVVHHLAAIRSTIDSKSYPLLKVNTSMLDQYASKLSANSRRSYSSLSSAIAALDNPETKKVLAESCSKELAPIAETYLLGRLITDMGFDTSINQRLMSKIYPDLKPPKAPGRKGKKSEE